MFTVMVVEDSKPILRNIQQQIEKTDARVKVTKQAYNGAQALAILKNTHIDIVFTDIRMPKMDGLTFIEEALKINPNVKTVLLTGYNDFEHARRAIQLNVSDYLLKPLNASDLQRVLNRLVDELQRVQREGNDEWLSMSLRQDAYNAPFRTEQFALFVLRQHSASTLPEHRIEREALHEMCSSAFPSSVICATDGHNASEKVVYVPLQETVPDIAERMGRLFRQFLDKHDGGVNMAYAVGRQEERSVRSLYFKLVAFLDHREILHRPQLLHWTEQSPIPSEMPEPTKEQLKLKWQALLKGAQPEPTIDSFRDLMYAGEDEPLRAFHSRLMLLSRTILGMKGSDDIGDLDLDALVRQSPSYSAATDAIYHRWFLPLYRRSAYARSSASETIAAIETYLRANLYRSVALQDLCNELNYSSSYIIRVFKKSRGMTPMEYYTKLKIEEAKKLIQENEAMLLKDIAEALHFYDQHHFAKSFKQYVGESPSEFRRRIHVTGTSRDEAGPT